jgi:hypothetical protein
VNLKEIIRTFILLNYSNMYCIKTTAKNTNARRKLFVDVSHNNNEISTENLIKKLNWRQKNNRRKHAVCFGIMGGQVNFAFHLVVSCLLN